MKMINFLMQTFRLKVSVIWKGGQVEYNWGKEGAELKLLEVSVALLTVGVRVTLRV